MINSRKKGFTLVELVIVIAVVAILAAVLIPTFSNLIKKANISADQQAVVQMNKILSIEEASGKKPETALDALNILHENGYNYSMDPYYSEYTLAWIKEENCVVLIQNNKIVYPEQYVNLNTFNLFVTVENDASKLQASIENLKSGEVLVITEDIKATNTLSFNFSNEGSYGINLNNNTLSSTHPILEDSTVGGTFDNVVLISKGNVLFSNGKITAENQETNTCIYITENATVTLDNMSFDNSEKQGATCVIADYNDSIVTINNTTINGSGNAVQAYESTIILNNATVTSHNKSSSSFLNAAIGLGADAGGKKAASVTVNGGTYTGEYFVSAFGGRDFIHSLIINEGTFNGNIQAADLINMKIFGGTFNMTDANSIAVVKASVQAGCSITINGELYSK